MSITSTSTLSDVLAEYNNSLVWEGDTTLARANLAAVRWLLVNRPSNTDVKGQAFAFDSATLQQQEKQLVAFITSASSPSNMKQTMFTRARL
jgi:hypothetical protein